MVRARSSTQPCAALHPNRINARAPTPSHCAQRRAFADVPAAAHLLPDAASRPREVVGGRAAAARSGVALPGWHAAAGHIFAAAAAPPICRAGSSLWQRTRSTRDAAVDLLGRRSGGGNVPLAAAALSAPAVADASAPHTAAAAAPSVRGRALARAREPYSRPAANDAAAGELVVERTRRSRQPGRVPAVALFKHQRAPCTFAYRARQRGSTPALA